MPTTKQQNRKPSDSLSFSEAAKLLWAEWEYRHGVFWNSLYRWGIATVAVTIAPYLLPNLIGQLQLAVLVFPFIAFLLAIFSAWHISAEYARLVPITQKYKAMLGEYNPESLPSNTLFQQFLKLPIGWMVAIAFLFVAFVVEFLNTIILVWLVIQSVGGCF